ncbi:MAG: disulfide bond formation protein DsbA [Xanthomonadales bacterium]|nr:disulfide bond formation protein DsbA [Xanthomonadales bacterium]|tara:strand:+ start:1643 stop:2359 length:717 start_codon:yes stop_codon:yes gene_type:complete
MSAAPNKNRSSLFGVLFVPALAIVGLIVIAIVVMQFTGNAGQPAGNDGPTTVDAGAMEQLRNKYDKLAEAQGPADAAVVIREFGDYQCPACAQFEDTAQRLREEYAEAGDVRFLFFDFPLPMHQNAQAAAVAARCAARQDQFWAYHNKLYATQEDWSRREDPSSTFLDMGLELGLDTQALKTCMSREAPLAKISAERDAGQAVSLRATPTVMVGDTMFVGAASYDKIKQAIEAARNGA